MKLLVEVTAEDIALGARYCPDRCPVAMAVKRAAGAVFVAVSNSHARFGWFASLFRPGESRVLAAIPADVWPRIMDFDAGREMTPFAFFIDLPGEG